MPLWLFLTAEPSTGTDTARPRAIPARLPGSPAALCCSGHLARRLGGKAVRSSSPVHGGQPLADQDRESAYRNRLLRCTVLGRQVREHGRRTPVGAGVHHEIGRRWNRDLARRTRSAGAACAHAGCACGVGAWRRRAHHSTHRRCSAFLASQQHRRRRVAPAFLAPLAARFNPAPGPVGIQARGHGFLRDRLGTGSKPMQSGFSRTRPTGRRNGSEGLAVS